MRSLVWLVSAVVSSVVRDVTLAVPAGLGLSELADQSGCALIEADTEMDRLAHAIAAAREPRLIVVKAGFQPDAGLVEEIDSFERREPAEAIAVLLATPTTIFQRVFPQHAALVGALVQRDLVQSLGGNFERLARTARRRGVPFQARARPIP